MRSYIINGKVSQMGSTTSFFLGGGGSQQSFWHRDISESDYGVLTTPPPTMCIIIKCVAAGLHYACRIWPGFH